MRYFIVHDFGTMVACSKRSDIPKLFGYSSWLEMCNANGGVRPDVDEITKFEYDNNEYYDVI